MITLNPQQSAAVPFVRSELAKGGEMHYSAPTGSGKMLVLAEAIRDVGRVAFVSRRREMIDQFKYRCESIGVTNVTYLEARSGLIGTFEVVIACETVRDVGIQHPCIIRC
ncbi:hypothetical protein EVC03_119 [Rhizobium phage RHph_Y5A]|nr:hypothetical protein EVC03_119 [Rhizobium phage RHph_Y5A]QIG75561.1 hypothetical protein EVC18_119 [Rhizobium phage RHph_Y2_4]